MVTRHCGQREEPRAHFGGDSLAEFPSLPLFTDAFLADAGHLDDAGMGRYMRLLMLLWRSPGCRVPNDREWIAHKLGRAREHVDMLFWPLVLEFFQCDGHFISQKRLTKEFLYCRKRTGQQSKRAKSRWDKEKEACRGNAASAMPPHSHPHHISEESKEDSSSQNVRESKPAADDGFDAFWARYPHKVGRAAAVTSWGRALKRAASGVIMAGLERYVATKPVDRSWCNPATWLNQDRWLDEPDLPLNGGSIPHGPRPISPRDQGGESANARAARQLLEERFGDGADDAYQPPRPILGQDDGRR